MTGPNSGHASVDRHQRRGVDEIGIHRAPGFVQLREDSLRPEPDLPLVDAGPHEEMVLVFGDRRLDAPLDASAELNGTLRDEVDVVFGVLVSTAGLAASACPFASPFRKTLSTIWSV